MEALRSSETLVSRYYSPILFHSSVDFSSFVLPILPFPWRQKSAEYRKRAKAELHWDRRHCIPVSRRGRGHCIVLTLFCQTSAAVTWAVSNWNLSDCVTPNIIPAYYLSRGSWSRFVTWRTQRRLHRCVQNFREEWCLLGCYAVWLL
jgi:hypothetical protein